MKDSPTTPKEVPATSGILETVQIGFAKDRGFYVYATGFKVTNQISCGGYLNKRGTFTGRVNGGDILAKFEDHECFWNTQQEAFEFITSLKKKLKP